MVISPILSLLLFGLFTVSIGAFIPIKVWKYWLVLISFCFCAWLSWEFSLVLVGFSIINHLFSKQITKTRSRLWLIIAIIVDLLFLVILRYQKEFFGLDQLLSLFTFSSHDQMTVSLVIPIGISFLVVQAIMLQIDLFHKRMDSTPDFWSTFLLLTYFPKMIAGPLERPKKFLSKFEKKENLTREITSRGLTLILIGIFRKFVIADPLIGLIPTNVFQHPEDFNGPMLSVYLIAYAFYLYNDFAGYSYLVRGISQLIGVELTNNFSMPYMSRNFSEFWTRWHSSLSTFLREYIYFPLSRYIASKKLRFHTIIQIIFPPVVTMITSALWHGLSGRMIFWGGLHAIYLIGERFITLLVPKNDQRTQPILFQWMSRLVVFVLVILAWIPFTMTWEIATLYYGHFINRKQPSSFSFSY